MLYIAPMTKIVRANVFAMGDGLAVALPNDFGVKPGDVVEIRHNNRVVEISTPAGAIEQSTRLADMVRRLRDLGAVVVGGPADGRIEFPDRPGLY